MMLSSENKSIPEAYYALYKGLSAQISGRPAAELRPYAFFVAWSGVIALVYERFPLVLHEAKTLANALIPGIDQENPGAMWPKTSLAARSTAQPLRRAEALRLIQLCEEHTERLQAAPPLLVDNVLLVAYRQRSLERTQGALRVGFNRPCMTTETSVDPLVAEIVSPSAVLRPVYLERTCAPGHDIAHYREDQAGWSMVVHVGSYFHAYISALREAIEHALPGRYAWFHESSLHVTVRGLHED